MINSPVFVALSIFAIFIVFNLYIRIRTFKLYRELVHRRIQFKFNDLFSKSRWEQVEQRYPDSLVLLKQFRTHMLTTGILFVMVIFAVLTLLLLFRNSMK